MIRRHWLRDLPELIKQIFPPRICKELKNLIIEVDPVDIQAIVEGKKGFFIFGETGTGKTLYASALLLESIYYYRHNQLGNPSALFVTSLDLLERIKRSFSDKGEERQDPIPMYSEADLLIIDDIGIEKVSEWVSQTLNYIINSRYEYLKPTIITSNFNLQQLQDHLGSRTISRIHEMTTGKHFNGKNYRLEKEGENNGVKRSA